MATARKSNKKTDMRSAMHHAEEHKLLQITQISKEEWRGRWGARARHKQSTAVREPGGPPGAAAVGRGWQQAAGGRAPGAQQRLKYMRDIWGVCTGHTMKTHEISAQDHCSPACLYSACLGKV